MARRVSIEIVADSRSAERELERFRKTAEKSGQAVNNLSGGMDGLRVRSRRAASLGIFRLGAAGLGAGTALFAATQAVRQLGDSLETTGAAAFTTEGRLKNMASALIGGNIVGAIGALTKQAKTIEDFGWQTYELKRRLDDLRTVASGATADVNKLGKGGRFATDEYRKLVEITERAGTANRETAEALVKQYDALMTAVAATMALNDWTARLGQTMVTQTGAVVTFKGAVDDLARAGRGEVPGSRTAWQRPRRFHEDLGPLSPSQRRELSLIGFEGTERLPGLRDRLRQLNNQMKDFHGNQEQRLRILTNIANTRAEIDAILADQAAKAKAAADERMQTRLGWLEFAVERAEATKTIKDDLKALRAVEAYWLERIRKEGRILEYVRELWRTRQQIRNLGKKDMGGDPLAGLMQVSTRRLTSILAAGTGLGAAGRRVLGANISAQQLRPIYMSVQLDGREVSKSVSQNQTRSGKRTGNQTSGRRG